jgi:hypothetical protein
MVRCKCIKLNDVKSVRHRVRYGDNIGMFMPCMKNLPAPIRLLISSTCHVCRSAGMKMCRTVGTRHSLKFLVPELYFMLIRVADPGYLSDFFPSLIQG